MVDTGRKPYFATNYQDMMRHVYMKPKGHSEGKKPYMENDYFDTEYPHLKKYNGRGIPPGTEPPIDPPIEPTECQQWFEKTIMVSGKDYFQDPKFIDKIYADLGECEKLHLIVGSCLQYNSLSFCICCAEAAYIRGGGFATQSDCAEDFGPVADGEWKCCFNPCPSFSIEVVSEDANTICYKATADCDIRVSWEKKIASGPWGLMDGSGCTDKAICGGQVKATDLCGNEETKDLPGLTTPTGTLTCSSPPCDEVVKSTTKQYTYTACDCASGGVTWSVSGTGASIDQNGLLTTTASACGTLTIMVTQPGCQPATQQVRVTDGGTWVLISNCPDPGTSGCWGCVSAGCGGCTSPAICNYTNHIVGEKRYNITRACLVNAGGCPSQAQYDAVYNCYLAAGGLACTINEVSCPCSPNVRVGTVGAWVEQWTCA